MGLVTYLCCSLLLSCSLLSDEFSDSSAPVCGPSHKRQSSVNFYNIGPSQRLQLFTNCSCLDPFQRVQSFRSRLLQHGPHGATGPDKTLLLHGLSRGLQRVSGQSTCSGMVSSTSCRGVYLLHCVPPQEEQPARQQPAST